MRGMLQYNNNGNRRGYIINNFNVKLNFVNDNKCLGLLVFPNHSMEFRDGIDKEMYSLNIYKTLNLIKEIYLL